MIKKSKNILNWFLVCKILCIDLGALSVAFKVGSKMITASGFMALIHGLIPAIFERNAFN